MVGAVCTIPNATASTLLPDGLRLIRATPGGAAALTLLSVKYHAVGIEEIEPYDEFAVIIPASHEPPGDVPYLSAIRHATDVRVVDLDRCGEPASETDSASAVSSVPGSVASWNIGGNDRGREASFAIQATNEVTITGCSVTTRNELKGRPSIERDTVFDGGTLPVTFSGEILVSLRDIESSSALPISDFVDPTSDSADIIIVLEFADGSTRTLGLG